MPEEVTLTQLAAEITQLRQQVEIIQQRLDMIYGAVTRLADQTPPSKTSSPQRTVGSPADFELSAATMMSPDTMLDALYQYAVKSGLDISKETVDHLKNEATESTTD